MRIIGEHVDTKSQDFIENVEANHQVNRILDFEIDHSHYIPPKER